MIGKRKASKNDRQPGRAGSIPVTRYFKSSANTAHTGEQRTARRQMAASVAYKRLSLTTLLTVVCAGSILLFTLLLLGSPAIKFTDGSVLYADKETYVQEINRIIAASFANKTKLTIQSAALEQDIKAAFPEISDVKVVVPLIGQRLQIGIRTKKPTLLLVQPNGQQAIVAEDGTIAAITDEMPKLPIVTVVPQALLEEREAVLTSKEVQLVRLLENEFTAERAFSVPTVEKYELFVETSELQVHFRDAVYKAKMTTQGESRNQSATLLAVFRSIDQGGVEKPESYIDVRVPGRVFIK
jgi:hypothetical protein